MIAGPFRILRTLVAALVVAAGTVAPARASDPTAEARRLVDAMGKTVIAILADHSLDKAARKARFRAMYRQNFDHPAIGSRMVGRAWTRATPAERREYLGVLEDYIVELSVGRLLRFEGERLLVLKSEQHERGIVVTSLVIHPNPKAMRSIEMRWHFVIVGGRLVVHDVVVDNISLALTERREFTSLLKDAGGTIKGLIVILREKITRA